MKFVVAKPKESILNLSRRLGYRPLPGSRGGEFSCQRALRGTDYPRFHLFIKEAQDKLVFNLHLDQKKPCYPGSAAHSGEYIGKVVKKEAERLRQELLVSDMCQTHV